MPTGQSDYCLYVYNFECINALLFVSQMKSIPPQAGKEGVVGGFVEEGLGVLPDDIAGPGEGELPCTAVVGVEAVVADLKRLNTHLADSAGAKNWPYL